METVVLIILLLVSLSFILKLTFHRPAGVAVLSLLTMAFTVFMTESASSQSKTRIADWLSQPELMLDTSVVLTIDVAFQICFCILMASRLSGTLRGLQSILLEITLWIPGLLLFPTLYSMLVAIIFSMPGADFDTIGWISGAAMMTATPFLAYGLKFILPETDLRLELIFLINLLIATLGIVATVNGRTAATGTNNVEWQALAAIFAIIISGLCAGWIYFRVRNSKKSIIYNFDKMNTISNILYWISTGLLVPVIVLLIFFFIRAIILIGVFFGQYMGHKKTVSYLYPLIKSLTPGDNDAIEKCHATKEKSVVASYAKRIIENKGNRPKIELLLSEYELDADKEIATSKVLAKMGPILGLMGTLIPMGPALVGLASGDIASMAYNMQVAFATTVVGLVVSAVGFVTQQMKERWAVANTTILEYLSDVIEQTSNSNAA